ncbi:MAG: hypothetical protein A3D82_01680 [Candidatus Levybacteria bacterium RIFCSPHIGHO2_02_FULL_40_29]|nr:MAG: hypothetical protein A3D82_01680 [Candidatus Levybacteria bacterium RIFCSPHIGHO2_02_FULL_40_29]
MNNNCLQEALYLLEKHGWNVIPVGKDKKPLIEWKKYQTIKATREEILNWFKEYPDANIAVVTGKISNLIVVDIDPRHGGTTKEFNRIITVKAKTGGDGEHFYFLYEEGIQNHVGIRPGIDIRGEGGFVITPPSIHKSGKRYEWSMAPHANTPIISLPSFVKDWIRNVKPLNESNWNTEVLKGVTEGRRNESAASVIGKLLTRFPKEEWATDVWPLVVAWNKQNIPPLSDSELRSVFTSIASRESISNQFSHTPIIHIPNVTDFLNQDFGNVEWLVQNLIPIGGSAILVAKRESYKTWLALYIANCISNGLPLWDRFETNKNNVLYISNDDPPQSFRKRLYQFSFDSSFFVYHQALPPFTIEQENGSFASVKNLIQKETIGLVIIDILRNTHNKDSNIDKDAKIVFDKYKELRQANPNLVLIFLIHPSKESHFEKRFSKRQTEEAVGSYYWEASVDTVLSLTKTSNEELTDNILITITKNKQSDKKFKPFIGIVRKFNTPVEFIYEEQIPDKLKVEEAKEAILLMLQKISQKRQELIEQLLTEGVCSKRTAETALAELIAEQRITHTKTKPHIYSLVSSDDIPQTVITNKDYEIA